MPVTKPSPFRLRRYIPRGSFDTPEQRLALAVLEEGLIAFQRHHQADDPEGRWEFRQVEWWIMNTNDDRPYSFGFLCDAIGLNAGWLRRLLRQWQRWQAFPVGVASLSYKPEVRRRRQSAMSPAPGGRTVYGCDVNERE